MPNIYSRYFAPAERQGLKKLPSNDFTSEINLFRILLIRQLVAEQAQDMPLSLKTRLAGLRALSHALTTLGTLIRTQQISRNPMDEFKKAIEQAIKELNAELNDQLN